MTMAISSVVNTIAPNVQSIPVLEPTPLDEGRAAFSTRARVESTHPLLLSNTVLANNQLNLTRFIAAMLVVFSHSFALTVGQNADPLFVFSRGQKTFGALAVDAFFAISGLLITRAWMRAPNMEFFFRSRVLRLYPGFGLAMVFSVLLMAVRAGDLKSAMVMLSALNWKSMAWCLLTLGFHDGVGNAPLWTIQIEFACYIGVAAYGLFGWFHYRWGVLLIACFVGTIYSLKVLKDGEADAWWRFACFFVVGSCFWLYRDRVLWLRRMAFIAAVLLAVGLAVKPGFTLLIPWCGTYLLLGAALRPSNRLSRLADRWDLSYGIYVLGWPVQATIVHFFHVTSPTLLTLLSAVFLLPLAWSSWTWVERPMLAMKKRIFLGNDRATELGLDCRSTR